eukprot:UN01138
MHDIFNLCYRIDSYAIFKKPIPFQIFQSNPATKLKCINAFSYLTGSIDKFNCIQNDVYSLFVKCNNRNLLTIQSYELFQWILHNIFGVNTYDQLDPEEDEDEEEEEEEEEVEQNCLGGYKAQGLSYKSNAMCDEAEEGDSSDEDPVYRAERFDIDENYFPRFTLPSVKPSKSCELLTSRTNSINDVENLTISLSTLQLQSKPDAGVDQ